MRLEARSLGFGYPGRRVGGGVSLDLQGGEVLVLLGANGSGKTTLLKTLLGLIPPQAGEVLAGERPLRIQTRQEIAHILSYVPQAQATLFPYTVHEVVLMGRT